MYSAWLWKKTLLREFLDEPDTPSLHLGGPLGSELNLEATSEDTEN